MLYVEVFQLEGLREIHLLQQFAIPMAPSEAEAAVRQRKPFGLEVKLVHHGDGLSGHAEDLGNIDITLALGGQ